MMKKNILLTFACAMVPGWGQMYQGFMRRGLSLMFWFFAVIGVSALLGTGLPCLLLPVIWAYSFFDTFNLRNLSAEQRMALGDFFIPNGAWMESMVGAGAKSSGRVIGIALLGLGALGLFGVVWRVVSSVLGHILPHFLGGWLARIPVLLVAAGLIYLGVRVLRGRQTGGGNHA